MSTRNRRANIPQAENILGEYLIDKDTRKITNAITILDRRFYDSLYPEYNPKDTLNEKVSKFYQRHILTLVFPAFGC